MDNGSMAEIFSRGSNGRRRSWLPALVLATLSLLLISVTAILTGSLSAETRISLDIVFLSFLIMLFIAMFWRRDGGDPFSFINVVLCGYIFMFIVPAFMVLYIPTIRTKPSYWNMDVLEHSVWIIIMSLFSLVCGYKLARDRMPKKELPLGKQPSIGRIFIVAFILACFYLVYLFAKAQMMGTGVWNVCIPAKYGSEFSKVEYRSGAYTFLNLFASGLSYLFFLYFLIPRSRETRAAVMLASLYVPFYVFYIAMNAKIATSKSAIFSFVFFLLAYYHYSKKRMRIMAIFIFILISAMSIILLNYYRGSYSTNFGFQMHEMAGKMYLSTFEDLETLCTVVAHISERGCYYGQILIAEVFYLPIPRAIWAGKPFLYGARKILYDINPNFYESGYHTGLQGQFYADFGLIGVCAGFFIFGCMIAWVYSMLRNNIGNKGVIILYISIVTSSWLYLKGGFPWLNLIITNFIPFYLVLCYIYSYRVSGQMLTVKDRAICG